MRIKIEIDTVHRRFGEFGIDFDCANRKYTDKFSLREECACLVSLHRKTII